MEFRNEQIMRNRFDEFMLPSPPPPPRQHCTKGKRSTNRLIIVQVHTQVEKKHTFALITKCSIIAKARVRLKILPTRMLRKTKKKNLHRSFTMLKFINYTTGWTLFNILKIFFKYYLFIFYTNLIFFSHIQYYWIQNIRNI